MDPSSAESSIPLLQIVSGFVAHKNPVFEKSEINTALKHFLLFFMPYNPLA
jgi:hypothetical protein